MGWSAALHNRTEDYSHSNQGVNSVLRGKKSNIQQKEAACACISRLAWGSFSLGIQTIQASYRYLPVSGYWKIPQLSKQIALSAVTHMFCCTKSLHWLLMPSPSKKCISESICSTQNKPPERPYKISCRRPQRTGDVLGQCEAGSLLWKARIPANNFIFI